MASSEKWDASLLPELLPIYYKKLFPFTLFHKWLRYGGEPNNYFRNREFSFTLRDDIYVRYRSYSDEAELAKDIKVKCPYKIDIGAVYSCSPKMKDTVRAGEFVAKYKELVFDIDMTDYDNVRLCCQGADICLKCWPLMTMAIKIINRALKEDFGFKHIMWVYSGRRGVHCWVSDQLARELSGTARSAIAEYLSVIRGGANMKKKIILKTNKIHPSLRKACEILEVHFRDYAVSKQDFIASDERYNALKELIKQHAASHIDAQQVMSNIETAEGAIKKGTSAERWEVITQALDCYNKTANDHLHTLEEIMLQYAYPRLDVNVSKGINHLLKSPFCIHPKTGRVCVPIDIQHVDSFNPFEVPTLAQLTEELTTNKIEGNKLDYKRTSLLPYIKTFEQFIHSMDKHKAEKQTTTKTGTKRPHEIEGTV